MDVRCDHKKHAELIEGVLEIKCRQAFCGHSAGSVVIHRWDALTGERLEDRRFAVPPTVELSRQNEEEARL